MRRRVKESEKVLSSVLHHTLYRFPSVPPSPPSPSSLTPHVLHRETRCIQSATLTIPDRCFRDKAKRGTSILKNGERASCRRRDAACDRDERPPKLFRSSRKFRRFFFVYFSPAPGEKGPRVIDEIDITVPGIER